jgi:hypothetical protein
MPAAVGDVLAQDGFDRADGSLGSAPVGGAWTTFGGVTWAIQGNAAAAIGGGGEGVALLATPSAVVSITTDATLSTADAEPSLSFRSVDHQTQLLAGIVRRVNGVGTETANRISLFARQGGSYTELETFPNAMVQPGETYQLRVDADGPEIDVYIDGVQVIDYTLDAALQSTFGANTSHGLRTIYGGVGGDNEDGLSRWDDFVVTDLRDGPTPPPPPPATNPAEYVSLTPGRLLDSRPGATTVDGQSAGIGLRPAGSVTQVQIAGRGGVPADAKAAVLNLTVTQTGAPGFATMWPCNEPQPNASTLNYSDSDVANAVVAKLDPTGKVCVFTFAATHLIVDVNGAIG